MAIDPKIIGARIRKKRIEFGLNQKELAEQVGVSPSAMNQFEKGEKIPSTDTLVKLAAGLGVSTDYLLGATVEEDIFFDNEVAEAFRDFKRLSAKDRYNIVANIKFLKEHSPDK